MWGSGPDFEDARISSSMFEHFRAVHFHWFQSCLCGFCKVAKNIMRNFEIKVPRGVFHFSSSWNNAFGRCLKHCFELVRAGSSIQILRACSSTFKQWIFKWFSVMFVRPKQLWKTPLGTLTSKFIGVLLIFVQLETMSLHCFWHTSRSMFGHSSYHENP